MEIVKFDVEGFLREVELVRKRKRVSRNRMAILSSIVPSTVHALFDALVKGSNLQSATITTLAKLSAWSNVSIDKYIVTVEDKNAY